MSNNKFYIDCICGVRLTHGSEDKLSGFRCRRCDRIYYGKESKPPASYRKSRCCSNCKHFKIDKNKEAPEFIIIGTHRCLKHKFQPHGYAVNYCDDWEEKEQE